MLIAEVICGVMFLALRPVGPTTPVPLWELIVSICIVIAALAARIGLFVFWRPARMLFLVTTVAEVIAIAFMPAPADTAVSSMLHQAATYIAGAILAFIYFSPVRETFERRAESV